MKRVRLTVFVFVALMISVAFAAKSLAQAQGKEIAVVEITDKVKVQDKILQGTYVFEHDDERMAKGKPCMYIYTGDQEEPVVVVASFHCTPVERVKAKHVVISVTTTSDADVFKLKEIQFAGSTKGHLVP
jgi:hypothetical protein